MTERPSRVDRPASVLATIGCLLDRHSDYGRDVALGANKYAQARKNWVVLHAPPVADPRTWVTQHRCAGLITQNCQHEFVIWLENRRVPAINISARLAQVPLPTVVPDNHAAGAAAAEHLLAFGLQHFAAIGVGQRELHYADLRMAGFVERVRLAGFACELADPKLSLEDWVGAVHEPERVPALPQWLRQLPKPAGLFLATHSVAAPIVQLCHRLEIRIPAELAIVAVDNDTVNCESIRPCITSVALNGLGVGFEAARLLDRILGGEPAPTAPMVIPHGGVVTRGSSEIRTSGNEAVAEALRYIQTHYQQPLYVEEIAQQVGLSRWHLQRLFLKERGCSLVAEINRARVARAKQLLSTTQLPTAEVARLCGFDRREYFSNTFCRHVGQPPAAFRRGQM